MSGINSLGPAARAIAGATTALLLVALAYFGVRLAQGVLVDTTSVNVQFGQIGQGLVQGGDVKAKGVAIGQVGLIELDENLNAVVELVINPPYQVPTDSQFLVTSKTLLGEKQVEVVAENLMEGPFLEDGALIDDPLQVVEFQDVLAETAELFEAIDPEDLAIVINDGIGAFDNQGTQIARAIDEGARATDVGVRILGDQVPATRDLSLVAEALQDRGDEFNRLGREIVAGLPTIGDNEEGTIVLLRELQRFSTVLDATLRTDRANLDRLFIDGDSVTRMLFAYVPEIGETLSGLYDYTNSFAGGGFTHPDTVGQAAPFQAFLDETEGLEAGLEELCANLPPELQAAVPVCGGEGGGGGDLPVPIPSELPVPLPTDGLPDLPIPVPSELPIPVPTDGLPDLPVPTPTDILPGAPGASSPSSGDGLDEVLRGLGLNAASDQDEEVAP